MSIKRNLKKSSDKNDAKPRSKWWGIAVVLILTLMLGLTINYRAFSEFSKESAENEVLEQRIQSVTTNNLSLQEQIHYLKNDPDTVGREARKFGLRRPQEKEGVLPPRQPVKKPPAATPPKQGGEIKVSVPVNK